MRPLVSTALFLEYEAVLMCPETRLAARMDAAHVEGFLAAFASAAEGVRVEVLVRCKAIQAKLDRLDEAFLFERSIDIDVYDRHSEKINDSACSNCSSRKECVRRKRLCWNPRNRTGFSYLQPVWGWHGEDGPSIRNRQASGLPIPHSGHST